MLIEFHHRFGPASSMQKLADLAWKMPQWFRPIWRYLVDVLAAIVRDAKIRAEMVQIETVSQEIADQWQREDAQELLEQATVAVQEVDPGAKVTLITDNPAGIAVAIEYSPTAATSSALGGPIRIVAPWALEGLTEN